MASNRYWLVLPAAGVGKRLGSSTPKQYLRVAGHSLIEWALRPFLEDRACENAVVALATADANWAGVRSQLSRAVYEVPGGAERRDSVLAALRHLKEIGVADEEWVLVHDAARPCVSRAEITALCQAVWQVSPESQGPARQGIEGGILALPLTDTVKRGALEHGQVASRDTLSREGLWRALTPQMFRLGALREALEATAREGRVPTDEAQAMEWQGAGALLVAGEATNIKVTTQSDLTLIEGVLSHRAREPR
ncbi:MAG: 2-C-methyl-D-erythritol 4-phosphate cytidylyltransferase [Steroidobacteraceae bacterium]